MIVNKDRHHSKKKKSLLSKNDSHFISKNEEEDVEEKSPSISANAFSIPKDQIASRKRKNALRNSL